MADTIIGEAAAATAAEGGAVVLIPPAEAEAEEAREEEAAPEPEVIEEPPPPEPEEPEVIIVPDFSPAVEARFGLLERAVEEHATRLELGERSLESLRAEHTANWQGHLSGHVTTEHEHPVPEDMRIISEELKALSEEETAPRRGIQRGWLYRKLRGNK